MGVETRNETRTGDAKMTSPNILTAKTIAALLEASDLDDAKDAEQAIKMIRALIETTKA